MRRLRALDWILVGTLVAAWIVALGLYVRAGLINECASLPFYVSSAPSDGYPRIDHVWRGAPELASLALGDRVIRVGDEDLRGVTAAGFRARAHSLARVQPRIPLVLEHDGGRVTVEVTPRADLLGWWTMIPFSAGLAVMALLILIRAPSWPLSGFATCLLFSINAVSFRTLGGLATYAQAITDVAVVPLMTGLLLWNTFEGWEARRPVRAWQAGLALGFTALFAGWYFWAEFLPLPASALGHLVTFDSGLKIAFLVSWFFAIAWTARRMTKLERRKRRWIGLGIYLGSLPYAALHLSPLFGLPVEWEIRLAVASRLAQVAIPVGILISVVAYQWLDIDRLISAAASYTIVGLAVLGSAAAVLPRLAQAAAPALGVGQAAVQWLLTVALVAAAIPVHRFLRPRIERRMFAERHQRMLGFELLQDEIGGYASAPELVRLAAERIDALLEPESIAAYARDGASFAPVFVRGRAAPAAFAIDSLLVRSLERRGGPLSADARELDAFDRAALETLGVALVVPTRGQHGVVAFTCLGPKQSGDIYTPEEIAQLGAVSGRCSEVLLRLADSQGALGGEPGRQVFRRDGVLWTIASAGKEIRLRDMRGLHYLATLLREPGREFLASDLIGIGSHTFAPAHAEADPSLVVAKGLGDAGAPIDAKARATYRERLRGLGEEQAEAERHADLGRLGLLSAEREALLSELEGAARGRRAASHSEHARVAVTKAIKAALDKITERHPELGAHLSATIRRGYACAYVPDPRGAVEWEV